MTYFKKMLIPLLFILGILYCGLCLALYFYQEKIIFYPQKLPSDYQFQFSQPFQEMFISTSDNTKLNGLLFTTNQTPSKGLIFYLHGNAGSLQNWGDVAKVYTKLGYDVFLLDYRGYGKSEGQITSEHQLFADNQLAFDTIKSRYTSPSQKIVILGYSVGTGMASHLACGTNGETKNQPNLLILQAPYISMQDMMRRQFPIIPTFLLKYQFDTATDLQHCPTPIVLFHGDKDEVIPYDSSLKLQEILKPTDKLITLKNQGHNGMTENQVYQKALASILD